MSAEEQVQQAALFPRDKLRWRLARALEAEYRAGALTPEEFEAEMVALYDTLGE